MAATITRVNIRLRLLQSIMNSVRVVTSLIVVLTMALAACSSDSAATSTSLPDSTVAPTSTTIRSRANFSFLVIDRCASIRGIGLEDNFIDENGEPIETDYVAILGVTVSSQTPIGSEVLMRFAPEPGAEPQQVRTLLAGPDKKLIAEFGLDLPGPYLWTVGGATAPGGARGDGSISVIIEAPDEDSVCDKSTLDETTTSTSVSHS